MSWQLAFFLLTLGLWIGYPILRDSLGPVVDGIFWYSLAVCLAFVGGMLLMMQVRGLTAYW